MTARIVRLGTPRHAQEGTRIARRRLDLLAGPSHHGHFSIGCYGENEPCCHRAMLRQLRSERGANVA